MALLALLPFSRTFAMIVCVCHRVSDQTIARCARAGMAFDAIQLELGVATQCGKCESCARSVWDECRPGQPVAHVRRQGESNTANAALPATA